MAPEVYYVIRKSLPLCPILSKMNPVHTLTSYLFTIHFSIVFSQVVSLVPNKVLY